MLLLLAGFHSVLFFQNANMPLMGKKKIKVLSPNGGCVPRTCMSSGRNEERKGDGGSEEQAQGRETKTKLQDSTKGKQLDLTFHERDRNTILCSMLVRSCITDSSVEPPRV